jgi:deoxyribose-phosphate aldolase
MPKKEITWMPVNIRELTRHDVARKIDFAILNPSWPDQEYLKGCETTRKYQFIAYHVLPSKLQLVVDELGEFSKQHQIELGAPIAFPYGSTPTSVKHNEAETLIKIGATALDMVANIGWLKDRKYDLYLQECRQHIELCHAAGINGKIIIEVGYLTEEEIVTATKIVAESGADFVKTATGTGPAGHPNFKEVQLIQCTLRELKTTTGLKVSGIFAPHVFSAYSLIRMGVERLGTRAAPEIVDALPEVQQELYP